MKTASDQRDPSPSGRVTPEQQVDRPPREPPPQQPPPQAPQVLPSYEGAVITACPIRFLVAVMGCVGMLIVYGLRKNLSVTIITMINYTAEDIMSPTLKPPERDCELDNDDENMEDGEFAWDRNVQGLILSSYYWGYIAVQIPGGYIADRLSAKWVMFFAVAINAVCTLLLPVGAIFTHFAVIALRVGCGLGGGVSFPAMHTLVARWSPPNERAFTCSVVYAGCALGIVFSTLFSGVLSENLSWHAVFYFMGGLSVIWLVLWIHVVSDSPSKNHLITEAERSFIEKSLNTQDLDADSIGRRHHKIPLKSIFGSLPFWAILVAHVCCNFGWFVLFTVLPLFMRSVVQLDMSAVTQYTSLAYFLMWVASLVLSQYLEDLRLGGKITRTTSRKVGTLIASVIPMLCFVGISFVACHRAATIVLSIAAIVGSAGMYCGYLINHIDIAPNFAGTLMAITNTVATIPGIVTPLFVGTMTEHDHTVLAWQKIFFTGAALYFIGMVFYGLFASGEVQEWNQQHREYGERSAISLNVHRHSTVL